MVRLSTGDDSDPSDTVGAMFPRRKFLHQLRCSSDTSTRIRITGRRDESEFLDSRRLHGLLTGRCGGRVGRTTACSIPAANHGHQFWKIMTTAQPRSAGAVQRGRDDRDESAEEVGAVVLK